MSGFLQYDSLKAVLLHIEPNIRFQISSRCPSIRRVESLTPLKINQLIFKSTSTIVNDTTYQVCVHRKCLQGVSRCDIIHYDSDPYGWKVDSETYLIHSDDVDFRRHPVKPYAVILSERLEEDPPVFDLHLQLRVLNGNGEPKIHRIPYKTRIVHGLRTVNSILLGNRNLDIKFLGIETEVVRLSGSFKPRVHGAKVGYWVSANNYALKSMVDPSSFPLIATKPNGFFRS